MNDLVRLPAMERLVPAMVEENLQHALNEISDLEPGSEILWDELKDAAGWPTPGNDEEDFMQKSRHSQLVDAINRHARKLEEGDRFQLRVIRGQGVEVLKGDEVLEHRRTFETYKVENAMANAVERLKRELECHQEQMTARGRQEAQSTVDFFEMLNKHNVDHLKRYLKLLASRDEHWK